MKNDFYFLLFCRGFYCSFFILGVGGGGGGKYQHKQVRVTPAAASGGEGATEPPGRFRPPPASHFILEQPSQSCNEPLRLQMNRSRQFAQPIMTAYAPPRLIIRSASGPTSMVSVLSEVPQYLGSNWDSPGHPPEPTQCPKERQK